MARPSSFLPRSFGPWLRTKPNEPRMNPLVTVVVPTCGRPELLLRCLAALEAQTLPAADFEIIVVDDTRRRAGPAAARNKGWRRATAAVVAFTDDDTVAGPRWVRPGPAAVGAGVDAACGRLVMPIPPTPTDYERNESGLERGEFVTANCFVRRAALQKVGGFDESFSMPWREDSDLQFRLLQAGCTIVRADDAVVVHPV